MSLSLRWDSSRRTSHDDLFLDVGEQTYRCDSYYMAIEEERPTVAVLEAVLAQWLRALDALADGATCFWPYDWSDEYTGWVRVDRAGEALTLLAGWSPQPAGYELSPCDYGTLQPSDWRPRDGSSPVRISIEECASAIRDSVRRLPR